MKNFGKELKDLQPRVGAVRHMYDIPDTKIRNMKKLTKKEESIRRKFNKAWEHWLPDTYYNACMKIMEGFIIQLKKK